MTLPTRIQAGTAEFGRWLSDNAPDIGMAILAAGLILVVLMALRRLGRRWMAAGEAEVGWLALAGRVLGRTRIWFMVAAALEIVAEYGDAPAWIERAVHIYFVIAFAVQAAIWTRELIVGAVESRVARDPDATTLANAIGIIRLLVTVAAFAIALVLALSNLGINVTGLVAGLGIGGIAIGLAAQGIFSDLFAALSIILDRPFRRGDTITFGNPPVTGTVEGIGLKTTRLRALDGEQLVVSNAKLLEQQIRNLARFEEHRRVLFTLPLLNRNDPAALGALPTRIEALVAGLPHCRFDHATLTGFGAHTTDMEVVFHVEGGHSELVAARHAAVLGVLREVDALGLRLNGPWPRAAEPD